MLAMLAGTRRAPDEVVAVVPPDLVPVTVEKVAVNAVMAGCLPEHLPVVLAAVEGFCTDAFNGHGLLATTYFSGPMLVVNGPVVGRGGLNSGGNALGQGNRANMTDRARAQPGGAQRRRRPAGRGGPGRAGPPRQDSAGASPRTEAGLARSPRWRRPRGAGRAAPR